MEWKQIDRIVVTAEVRYLDEDDNVCWATVHRPVLTDISQTIAPESIVRRYLEETPVELLRELQCALSLERGGEPGVRTIAMCDECGGDVVFPPEPLVPNRRAVAEWLRPGDVHPDKQDEYHHVHAHCALCGAKHTRLVQYRDLSG